MIAENKITYHRHGVCLIALFILGNTLLTFPSGADAESGIYALILALIPAFIYYGIYGKLLSGKRGGALSGKFGKAVAIPLLLLSIFSLIICCRDYTLFIDTMRLPNTSLYVITGIFVALGFLLGLSRPKVLYLFSLLGFVILFGVLVIMLIFSIPNMKSEYLNRVLTPDVPAIFRQGAGVFIQSLGQGILLVLFLESSKKAVSQQYGGLILGALLLGVSFLNVLAVLGGLSTRLDYPYISVSEMVSFGRGYSRMEGLSYAVYFICALIKTSLLINVTFRLAMVLGRNFKILMYVLLPLIALLGVSRLGGGLFTAGWINVLVLAIELVIPVVLIINNAFKKGTE